jgi:signal transduction histidine kinase
MTKAWPILSIAIKDEADVVVVRQRAKMIAELVGFEVQDQTRIATAVSEIARNAFEYAGKGRAAFSIEQPVDAPQRLTVVVEDSGPGMKDPQAVLDGMHVSKNGLGIGVLGAKRLVDQFDLQSHAGKGTRVELGKSFARRQRALSREDLMSVVAKISNDRDTSPLAVLKQQNRELVLGFEEIRHRQDEVVQLNRELEETNRGVVALHGELEQKADELRRASELKTRFLSHMSHEFRTPLNSILALSDLLMKRVDGDLTSEQERQVGFIRRSAESLYELVNDLLDIAKLEAGRTELRISTFTIEDLIGGLRGVLKPLQKGNTVQLVFEDPPPGLPPLTTDEGKVVQIIRNFVSNALKFTTSGEVRVRCWPSADRNDVFFAVSDTGIGIDEKDRDRIFDEFSQIDSPTQRLVKGTGLGLALCRRLADVLKGQITLESSIGRGSTFTLAIPANVGSDVAQCIIPVEPVGSSASAPRDAEAVVLVVDDDPAFRYALRQMISNATSAYTVIEAHDGVEALAKARDLRPDVIVLDLQMPNRDGYDVLADLLLDPVTQKIPVLLSSSADYETINQARIRNARAFLAKRDISPRTIGDALDRILGA